MIAWCEKKYYSYILVLIYLYLLILMMQRYCICICNKKIDKPDKNMYINYYQHFTLLSLVQCCNINFCQESMDNNNRLLSTRFLSVYHQETQLPSKYVHTLTGLNVLLLCFHVKYVRSSVFCVFSEFALLFIVLRVLSPQR